MDTQKPVNKTVSDLLVESLGARRYEYLGHRPGPGFDLRVNQLSDRSWKAEGITPCGRAFILKVYGGDRYGADNQRSFLQFRQVVEDWGLTMEIHWPKAEVEEL